MLARLALLFLVPSLLSAQESAEALRIGSAEFQKRRATLLERLPDAPLVLESGKLKQVGDDENTPLFDFKYLCGVHDDKGLLVIKDRKMTVFVSDPATAVPVADAVFPIGQFAKWAEENLAGQVKIHAKLRGKNLELLQAAAPKPEVTLSRLGSELTKLRLIKSETEIRLIRKASDATNAAHVAVMKALKPGMNEKELEKLIKSTFEQEGCPRVGFPSIVGAGKNGTILHYMKNNQEIPKNTLIVFDIGAEIENYVSDITRTLPTSGKYSDEQRKHYQCVLDAQKAAEAILKPGATFGDLDRAARKVFEDRGLRKWSYAHSNDGQVRHGLGHYVGMSVHDSGGYRERFEPGMVITIEPGWYDKDAGYGIRIEDIYLVTKDGCERLSAGAPREIEEIEKVMKGKRDF